MMNSMFPMGIAAVLLSLVSGCSNDSNGGTGAAYSVTSCPNKTGATATCNSCLEASCPSQVSAANSACADVIACNCPAGSDAAACPAQSSACDSATVDFLGCALAKCASACGASGDGGVRDGG
jgi:hypothetical protein